MSNSNGAIGWDDEVSVADAGDSAQNDDIVVLPNGTYPCKIMKVERGSFKGSQKLPPCNKVKVGVIIDGGDAGRGWADHNFYMHTSTLWKIFQFMEAIGLRKKGDTTATTIPWAKVTKGMSCRCKVTSREWNDKTYNEVTEWLPPSPDGQSATGQESDELDDLDF